jgi:two-component system, cell cycle response regulator DivK
MKTTDEAGTQAAAQAPEAQPPGESAPVAKQRVLVVEDYDDAREMYTEYLEYAGFEVDTARDGQEAIERAQEGQPDIILMDMSLPLVSGWEATRRLKEDERTRAIPVVAVTGHTLPGHAQQASDAGCEAFVTKPALPADIEKQIRAMLSRTKSRLGRSKRSAG